jgi:phosphoglycerate dehydrogenase-like enzyme
MLGVMSTKPRVIITEHLDSDAADWLAERTDLVHLHHDDPAFDAALAQADGLVIRTYTIINDALLDRAPKLKVVGRAGVGLDNVDLPACQRRGVMVVSTPDANTQAVVEYVWALVLDAKRPRAAMVDRISPADFHGMRKRLVGPQIQEMTLGILGMGRIGRRIAQVARAIGMNVVYNDLLQPDELHLPAGDLGQWVDKPTLWSQSDILTIHVDGRHENRHLIDAGVLEKLRYSCLLINTSRGFVIDAAALAAWARSSAAHGGGAVLDVHEPEPPPVDYALWGLGNVRLLPHLASRTHRAMSNMSWVVKDVAAVLGGERPKWPAF